MIRIYAGGDSASSFQSEISDISFEEGVINVFYFQTFAVNRECGVRRLPALTQIRILNRKLRQ
jgi:hypothetical protein